MRIHLLVVLALLVFCSAQAHGRAAGALVALAANAVSDAGAAARTAAGMSGGRVLDVQTRYTGGRPVYDVKVLLEDGRVRIIQVDGKGAPGAAAEND